MTQARSFVFDPVTYPWLMIESRPSAARSLQEDAAELVRSVKPKLRGWLHAGMTPLAAAAGIVLVCLAPTTRERLGAAAFALTAVLLFATSAAYHRGTWSTKVERTLKRMDHSNIFLIIAGTYTPFAVTLLRGSQEISLLLLVWGGAILGVLFRVFWVGAPRWLYTPIYVALGWVAIFYFGPLLDAGGAAVMTLIAVGGALYTLGAIVYGIKKPNPSPQWFGFHEVFHSLTILAFISHYIAVSLAIYGHHH